MSYSFFNQTTPPKTYLPDSIFMVCGEDTQECNVCSNVMYSPVVKGYVHDTLRGKVFCPFGAGESMNRTIYGDQQYLYSLQPQKYQGTTWGRAPQLGPRTLAKIGLEYRTA